MLSSLIKLFRNAYGGLSRDIWLLALTQLINRSGSMVLVFLSVYLHEELKFSLGDVGVIMALFGAGSFLGVFVGGKLIDKIGYYPVMLFSLFLGGIMFIIVGQLQNFYVLCVGVFVLSALADSYLPANMAAVSHYSEPGKYTRSISLNRLAINLGFAIGPALGGFLSTINYSYIFWADGLTCIAAGILIVFSLDNKSHHERTQREKENPVQVLSPMRDKAFLLFLPLVCLYAIAFFQFFSTMPLYYRSEEGFTKTEVGWIMALNGAIVMAVEMILIYKFEKKWSIKNFVSLGAALLMVSYLSMILFQGKAWMVVVTIVISFSEIFALPFMNTFMDSRTSAGNKGRYAALYGMSWSVARVATPIIATQVITHWDYNALWVVLATMALIVWVGFRALSNYADRAR